MNITHKRISLIFVASMASLAAGPPTKPAQKTTAAKKPDITAIITPNQSMSRELAYRARDVPTIHARMNYTTVIVLPKNEQIMDFVIGHKGEWTVNGAAGTNFAYIKPEKAGVRTNLNLVTASGNVYSFLIDEDSEYNQDLKVFVTNEDEAMKAAETARPKWVLASELEAERERVNSARSALDEAKAQAGKDGEQAKASAQREISEFRSSFPSSLKHDYKTNEKGRDKGRFGAPAIAHSANFTYIWANPQETPTLYEVADGKPSLINFDYSNGVYIVQKVMQQGYLSVGKHRFEFKREE